MDVTVVALPGATTPPRRTDRQAWPAVPWSSRRRRFRDRRRRGGQAATSPSSPRSQGPSLSRTCSVRVSICSTPVPSCSNSPEPQARSSLRRDAKSPPATCDFTAAQHRPGCPNQPCRYSNRPHGEVPDCRMDILQTKQPAQSAEQLSAPIRPHSGLQSDHAQRQGWPTAQAQDPPYLHAQGSVPVEAPTLHICAFCACGLSWSGRAPWLPPGADQGPGPGRAHRIRERADVVGAVVPLAVDEERGRARDAAQVGGVHVRGDLGLPGVVAQVAGEPAGVQANSPAYRIRSLPVSAPWWSTAGRASARTCPGRPRPRRPRPRAARAGARR